MFPKRDDGENKGKLFLTEIFPSVQKHAIFWHEIEFYKCIQVLKTNIILATMDCNSI